MLKGPMLKDREVHLRDYIRLVVKRRYTVYTFFAVVFAITLIINFSAVPVYMATTKVLIEKNEPGNLAANFYYLPYDPDFGETQYQLIKGTSVAQRVVNMLSLDRTYESFFNKDGQGLGLVGGTVGWFKGLFSVVGQVTGISGPNPLVGGKKEPTDSELAAKRDSLAKMISGSLIVAPIKNSKLVNISYMSTNPEVAALIVNSVAKAYMEDMMEMKMNSSQHAMKWMTEKAEEERTRLDRSEKALQEYMRNKDIVTLENRIAMVPEKLSEVATRIAVAETKRKEMESLYNKVKGLGANLEQAETIPAISADLTVQALRGQIMKAEQNIMEMSKKFGQKHPSMITAQSDLKVLKEKREQEIRRVIESIKNDYEMAKTNEEAFRKLASQTKSETLNLSEKFIQFGALKREAETNKQLFEAIIKKIKEQDVTQDIQTVSVWVVEKAEVPKSPASPNKTLNLMYGLLAGIFGGIGLAFFVEYLDNTVKSPDDIEEKLGAPVLGMVTLLKSKEHGAEEAIMKDPRSQFSENYKVIRTSILLSSSAGPPKNMLITSTSPGEGKTVTSVNLAMAMSQVDQSVLLIDSDLRKPRIHKIFGLDNSKGLSTYLASAPGAGITSHEVSPHLHVVTSGPIPPNPSELLGSARMQDLLAELNERFDIIIWDSAPLLTVTDSLILSKALDGTVVIARAGQTTHEMIGRGLKSLSDIEAHFLGIIINGVDLNKGDYYYHYYSYSDGDKSA